ncbi:hypothetical protein [Nocardia noduli]|uniref:hypothetical protein n=1 Tax=Nocardia noduli TaxID=2815722 RepID=UPI001C230D45|nr:hypothetical protein [Nocardia noduli]
MSRAARTAAGVLLAAVAFAPVAQAAPIVPVTPESECVATETSCEQPATNTPAPRPPSLPQPGATNLIPQPKPAAPNANPPAGALVPPTPGAGRGVPIVPVG